MGQVSEIAARSLFTSTLVCLPPSHMHRKLSVLLSSHSYSVRPPSYYHQILTVLFLFRQQRTGGGGRKRGDSTIAGAVAAGWCCQRQMPGPTSHLLIALHQQHTTWVFASLIPPLLSPTQAEPLPSHTLALHASAQLESPRHLHLHLHLHLHDNAQPASAVTPATKTHPTPIHHRQDGLREDLRPVPPCSRQ